MIRHVRLREAEMLGQLAGVVVAVEQAQQDATSSRVDERCANPLQRLKVNASLFTESIVQP
jgi:hypothetical protein